MRFSTDLNSLDTVSQNTQISNFIKIHPVGAELFHVDGWTNGRTDRSADMMKLIVAFHNFLNVLRSLQLTHKLRKLCSFLVQLLSDVRGDVSTSN